RDEGHRRRSTMLFSSPLFLFLYLPILLGLYAAAGPRLRNPLLVLASLFFYIWGEGTYVLVMIAIIAVNDLLGRWIDGLAGRPSAGLAVWVGVAVHLALLLAFKSAISLFDHLTLVLTARAIPPVRLDHVHLPLGISFFTFHALSYVIDIARNNVQPG